MNLQKRYLLMGGAVLAILLTLAAGLLFWGRRPFRGLEAARVLRRWAARRASP